MVQEVEIGSVNGGTTHDKEDKRLGNRTTHCSVSSKKG